MGACGSSKNHVADEQGVNISLLLLGSANVGKSTIFKQMRLLYENGFTDADRVWAKGCVIENVLETLSDLDALSEELGIDVSEENEDLVDEIKPVLLSFRGRDPKEPPPVINIWEKIVRLWQDQGIQEIYERATSLKETMSTSVSILDNASYFLMEIDRIRQENYVPSDADVLRLRRATANFEKIEFSMQVTSMIGKACHMHISCKDVGGQAHEQSEWSKHCDNLNAVIFVMAISEFNAERSDGQNVFQSQLNLLESVCNSECFKNTVIIILLNKYDIFREKLSCTKISDFFLDYSGDNSEESAFAYFTAKCLDAGKGHHTVKTMRSNATDTQLMNGIIESIGQAILQRTLTDSKYFGSM